MVNPRIHQVTNVIAFITLLLSVEAHAQSWHSIAPMKHARVESSCIKLNDGRILIAGGYNAGGPILECEIYDPFKNQWSTTGLLNQGRYRFPMLSLDNGKILVIGGLTDLNVATTATCELYDPTTGMWSFTASLPVPSENATAIKLPDGRIFAAGGLNAPVHQYVKFAGVYD